MQHFSHVWLAMTSNRLAPACISHNCSRCFQIWWVTNRPQNLAWGLQQLGGPAQQQNSSTACLQHLTLKIHAAENNKGFCSAFTGRQLLICILLIDSADNHGLTEQSCA